MKYEKPIIDIEMFATENIITTSGTLTQNDLAKELASKAKEANKDTTVVPFNF